MADIYTYKSPMGKTTKYLKKGGKYYRIKANGQLAKEPTTGSLILGNLKNKDSSFVEKVNAKETKRIVSKFTMPDGKAEASTVKTSIKEDGGYAQFLKDNPTYLAEKAKKKKAREKAALAVVKKDTNNLKVDKKSNVKNKSKSITDMRTKDVKMVTLKSGKKGTIKQRLAEIDADKEKAQRAKNSPKANKALDAVFAMLNKDKTKKLKGGGMTMKKKTKYMAKGGYGTPTKKMVMKAGGTAKKTKYMAKGGVAKKK